MDLNASIANLQEATRHLSAAADMSQDQLEEALRTAHELLNAASQVAAAAQNQDLIDFLTQMGLLLQQLMSCAPAKTAEQLQGLAQPAEILANLTGSYRQHIAPMIQQAQEIAGNSQDENLIAKWSAIGALGFQVFNSCSDVINYHDQLEPREKVYALTGTVLMVSGVGLLVAATLFPQVGISVFAALTVVTLGCSLCQKAVAKHKNAQAQEVHKSLYRQSELIQETANSFQEQDYPSSMLMFSDQQTSIEQATEEPAQPAPKPSRSLGEALAAVLKSLLARTD